MGLYLFIWVSGFYGICIVGCYLWRRDGFVELSEVYCGSLWEVVIVCWFVVSGVIVFVNVRFKKFIGVGFDVLCKGVEFVSMKVIGDYLVYDGLDGFFLVVESFEIGWFRVVVRDFVFDVI